MENLKQPTDSIQAINLNKKYIPDDNVTYRPILSYSYYIFSRIFKNKSTWIIAIISFVFTLFFGALPGMMSSSTDTSYIVQNIISYSPLLIIVFCVIFSVIKSLNIFSDSQSDGTELIIVSKPISRTQIIWTRFAFFIILGLVYSTLLFLAWFAGLAITGLDKISNLSIMLPGAWGAGLISYLISGVITILISLKFSSRLAVVLPLIIMSASLVISQLMPLFVMGGTFPQAKLDEIQQNITDDYKGRTKFKFTQKVGGIPNEYTVQSFKIKPTNTSGSTIYSSNYISVHKQNNKSYLYYSNFIVETKGHNFEYTQYLGGDSSLAKDEWDAMYKYLLEQTAKTLSGFTIDPNPIVALNFINPVSAFTSIAGLTANSVSIFGAANAPAYNFKYSDFEFSNTEISVPVINFLDPEFTVTLPYSIDIKDATQIDSSLNIGLMWFGIFTFSILLSLIFYYRKDFK